MVAAVGADRPDAYGLTRAEAAGVPTFVHPLTKGADRAAWDAELTRLVAAHEPELIIQRRLHEAGRSGVPRPLRRP